MLQKIAISDATCSLRLPIFSFRQRPGELDYAELDEFRRHDAGHAPGPSGASAAAVVRPPAYEGTEYADITQFGVPQPDPTYANVSGGDVTYSNMQSMWVFPKTTKPCKLCQSHSITLGWLWSTILDGPHSVTQTLKEYLADRYCYLLLSLFSSFSLSFITFHVIWFEQCCC